MRIWITGGKGLVGSHLCPLLEARGHELGFWHRSHGDITEEDSFLAAVEAFGPEVLIHLAAFTAVDRCEADASEAHRVNEEGTRVVARTAESMGATLVLLSSDYVFDGSGSRPYREEDSTGPLNVYGKTKLLGEWAAKEACSQTAVVRTAWLYDRERPSFVRTVLDLAETRDSIQVVRDQTGSPTFVPHLAEGLCAFVERQAVGTYHLAGAGSASWYDLARAVFEGAGLSPHRVEPVTTDQFPRPAPRPRYSVLDCSKIQRELGISLPPWRRGVQDYFSLKASS